MSAWFPTVHCTDAHLLPVLPPAAVQTLDDGGRVTKDEGETCGTGDHGDHGEPEVRHVLRGEPTVADTEHVRHRLEEGPGVLLPPAHLLQLLYGHPGVRGKAWHYL